VVVIGAADFDVDGNDKDVPVFLVTDVVAVVFLLCVVLLPVLGVADTAGDGLFVDDELLAEAVAVVAVVAILVAVAAAAGAITAASTVVATTGGAEALLVSAGCDTSSTCDRPSVILYYYHD
jgi:hypothetical protein